MSKEIYISSTPHETRLAIVENDALTEIYYERENEYTLAGSIYNGKVTRVLPGMQSSFVDIGLERDAFLYITDFMEEAGDSADFEAHANSGDHARAPRQEGSRDNNRGGRSDRGDRNDRGDRSDRAPRGDRDQQPRIAAEPTDADLFADAVSGLDPARPVSEQERGDRGGRRGGRNRRDRSSNGNANGEGAPRRDREPRSETSRAEEKAETAAAPQVIIPHPDGEVGEGAPGADGSRRWRGRRGRRGNRGGREESAQPVTAAPADRAPSAATGPVYDAYPTEPADNNEGFEFDGVAAPEQEAPAARPERGGRGERNRRDRGNQPPRAPRGFAPSTDLYKVDSDKGDSEKAESSAYEPELAPVYGLEAEMAAPSEPVILPGESLGKYRPGGDKQAEAAKSLAVTAAPVVDFVVSGWDGGMVLPGETIRPRGRGPVADASSEPRRESRGDRDDRGGRNDRGRGGRGDRDRDRGTRPDGRSDRGPRTERIDRPELTERASEQARPVQAPFIQPASAEVIQEFAPESPEVATYLTDPEHVPASHLVTPVNSTFVPPPPVPVVEPEVQAAPEQEFEPSEASASYRVDPTPPSEYRQPAPPAAPVEPVLETASFAEPLAETAPVEQVSQAAEDNRVETDPADLHTVSPALQHAFEAHTDAPAAMESQVTSISDTGNMHSEFHEPVAQEMAAIEEPNPTSPIEHESVIVNDIDLSALPESAHSESAQAEHAASFAPGTGVLEEEMLEDEDEGPALDGLHAASSLDQDHHQDDDHSQDQETLEGAADLGSMLREMSIDQITRPEPSLDEDEEDDFLEEDQDYDTEESELEDSDEMDSEGEDESGEHAEPLEHSEYGTGFEGERAPAEPAAATGEGQEPRREGRGDRGRREGRRGDRNRRPGGGERSGNSDRSGGNAASDRSGSDRSGSDRSGSDRSGSSSDRGRRDGRGGRPSMQTTNLPAISDLLKPGQEILCQIAKEPIAKKGARITSHIALPGRFLVFMPTVSHTGVSRKIESDQERRRLKEILLSEKGEAAGGFIVRTAASGASEEELRSDLRFLLNLWSDIKARSESSKSPALIYHDLNLVERVLRDQVTDTFSAIWVDTETEYERVLRFLQRFQPSLIRRVKLYTKETPLFEQFGITEEINKALRSKVWLKSGGSIVINQTEALVAIDINTGKFVGKTARLEDTIVKTNLDAIPEIVRQIRLRDLGGIIIIDFIDMDERKNRNKVMAALEEELKSDRAPSKVLQFNDFGLVAITRKRVKQSLERTLSTTCGICAGTGMVKSPVTVCNDIYIEMRKMHKHLDRGDVMLRVNPEVVKQLKSTTSRWLQEMEEMVGKTILVKSDPSLHPEQFDIH